MLSKVIKKDRKFILLNLDKELDQSDQDSFKDLILKRSKGKPLAYLTGIKSFWKYDFKINEKSFNSKTRYRNNNRTSFKIFIKIKIILIF